MSIKSDTAIVKEVSGNADFMGIVARETVENPGVALQKYLNFDAYIRAYYKDAQMLGLDSEPPRRILDIGTGVGYFPYICAALGNTATAIDVDDYPVYNATTAALGIDRYVHRIKAFEPLPALPTKFDLITAFAICFNNHKEPALWGVDEWRFFLRDLASNYLAPGGKLFFRFNVENDGAFGRPDIPEMLRSSGAVVVGNDVRFDDTSGILRG